MENTPQKNAASRLAEAGFKRDVAGTDFDRISKAADRAASLGVGLLLSGATGAGKSYAMRCLYPKALFVCAFDPVEVAWLDDRSVFAEKKAVVIDDLGADAERNQFGVWTSPLTLFFMRADAARDRGGLNRRIHVTTNLTSSEIDAKYGDRFLTRLLSLTVPVRLGGGDHRPRHTLKFEGEA
jgi:hypothetical protein